MYNLESSCSPLLALDGILKMYRVLYSNQNVLVYRLNSQQFRVVKPAKFQFISLPSFQNFASLRQSIISKREGYCSKNYMSSFDFYICYFYYTI